MSATTLDRSVAPVSWKEIIEMSLTKRDSMTELGDNIVRSLEARIIEIVCIKRQQEDATRKVVTPKDIAKLYMSGSACTLRGHVNQNC